MIAIFTKELRDCLRWVPAGMLISVVMIWQYLPKQVDRVYQLETDLISAIGWSAFLVALGLGLLQSLFDIRNDARGYLLHRPVHRSTIFWAKLASGFVAYVLSLTPGVLLALIFFYSNGLDYLPVSVWQVIPGLMFSLAVFLVHPVALWIGTRDAKWVGTRILPLVGISSVLLCIVFFYEGQFGNLSPYYLRLLLGIMVWAIHIAAFVVVLVAARHAFCESQMLHARSRRNALSWASIVGLTFSSLILVSVIVSSVIGALTKNESSYASRELLMNSAGKFQQVSYERDYWNYDDLTFTVQPAAAASADFKSVDDQWELAEYSVLQGVRRERFSWFKQFRYHGHFGRGAGAGEAAVFYSHRGRFLAYGQKRLRAILTPQGVSANGETPKGRFENLGLVSSVKHSVSNGGRLGINPFVLDSSGLFQLDSSSFELNRLLSTNADRMCMLFADQQSPASLWTLSGGKLTQHEISAVDNQTKLSQETLTKNHEVLLPLIKVDRVKQYEIDLPGDDYSISIFRADDGRYGYVKYISFSGQHFYGMLSDDGSAEKLGPVVIPLIDRPNGNEYALSIPPILSGGRELIGTLFFPASHNPSWGFLLYALVHALLAAGGTFVLCKWLDLTRRQCWVWTLWALLGGWGICLAVVSCYRRLVKEACPHCQKATRVDVDTCAHCSQIWLPPQLEKIEIFDGAIEAA